MHCSTGRRSAATLFAITFLATPAHALPIDLPSLGLVKSTPIFADLGVFLGANPGVPAPFVIRNSDPAVVFGGAGGFRVLGPPFDFEGFALERGTDGPDEMEWLLEPQSGLATLTDRVLLEVTSPGLGTAIDALAGFSGVGQATVFNLVAAPRGPGGGAGGGGNAQVPLPAGGGLLMLGLAALGLSARRSRPLFGRGSAKRRAGKVL